MSLINDGIELLQVGGWVSIPLILSSGLLWYTIASRVFVLQRQTKLSVRGIVSQARSNPDKGSGILFRTAKAVLAHVDEPESRRKKVIEEEVRFFESELGSYRNIIATLVMIAPLMGLLGTVIGMIETFESLGDMHLFSQTGGIAGGISQALITTQMGLIIAIPGLLFDRFLKNLETKRLDEIAQIKEVVCQI